MSPLTGYRELIYKNHIEILSEIENFVDLRNGKKVLDFGCGSGAGTVYFASQGIDIIGIDNNQPGEDGISEAKEYALEKGSKAIFKYMDGEKMDFADQVFDIVLMIDVLEHILAPQKVLKEIERILKVGGLLIVIWQPFFSPFGGHLRFYSKNPWRQLMPFFNKEKYLKKACKKYKINTYEHEISVLNSLNKLTLRKFRKIISCSGFKLKVIKKRLFKTGKDENANFLEEITKKMSNKLPLLPFIDEFTNRSVLMILEKEGI